MSETRAEIHLFGVSSGQAQAAIRQHGQPACDCGEPATVAVFVRNPDLDKDDGTVGIQCKAACEAHEAPMREAIKELEVEFPPMPHRPRRRGYR